MEIVLALLRTLVFVVATVAATVYVSRRIGRGRPLLWTGTTVLALYWLMLFGWTSYLTGNANPSADLSIWVAWGGHLLPFFAALAYILGIGQSAGFPSRAGAAAGAAAGKGTKTTAPPVQPAPASQTPAVTTKQPAEKAATAGDHPKPVPTNTTAAPSSERTAQPFPGPHAVPVVMNPASESPYGQGEPSNGPTEPGSAGGTGREPKKN